MNGQMPTREYIHDPEIRDNEGKHPRSSSKRWDRTIAM